MHFCHFTKIELQHGRFPENFWKILGKNFYRKPLKGCVIGLNLVRTQYKKAKIIKVVIQLTISGFFRTHFLSVLFNCSYFTDYLFVVFSLFICLYIGRFQCFVSSRTVLLKLYRTHNSYSF